MADFSLGLYFEKSVTRADLVTRISALPELVVEDVDNYWSGPVHLVFHDGGLARIQSRLASDFCLEVGVHSYARESSRRMNEVLVSLLAGGQDAIGVFDFNDIAFTQSAGQLTLDSSDAVFADEDRADFRQARPCAEAPLGRLQ